MTHTALEQDRMRQASDWLVKLHDDELSSEQISQWLEWSQAHPDNLQAFEQVKLLMRDIRGLDEARKAQALQQLMARRQVRSSAWRYAAAAAVVLMLGAGGYVSWRQHLSHQIFDTTYMTAKAQNRVFTLPDGTRVEMGAGSRLHVGYTAEVRHVELIEGEAFFETETDSHRPFLVNAGEWRLSDIGTAFNVRKTHERVVVTVTEGIVDIAPLQAPPPEGGPAPLRLLAGDQVIMDPSLPVPETFSRVALEEAVSWQQGQLRFNNEPLPIVVANLNRYSTREIFLDPRLQTLRFSGTVLTGNVEGWLEAACRVFSLVRSADGDRIELAPSRSAQFDSGSAAAGRPRGSGE